MGRKKGLKNWPRILLQWGVIAVILIIALIPRFKSSFVPDFEAYCPFGGLQAFGSYLLTQALSCTMTTQQIAMGILLMLGVFAFSKLFCSYVCPVGTVSEWLGKLGDDLHIRYTIRGIADKVLRSLKYILLFLTLYFTFQSNELFCKKFDPYFGIASGFNTDVVLLWSVIAIALVIIGSVFIRLFWCKYICPFGALSNIFKFAFFFIGVLVVYIILLRVGLKISYVWPLAIASIGGYLIEIFGSYGKLVPWVRVTRNEESCINCQLCSKKCPQAIDVANVDYVRHADCNLCSECVLVCPVKNTLQFNRKNSLKWSPPIATISLILLGLFLGSQWEVPTIDQKWYDEDLVSEAAVYTHPGLKSVKCYGSSMALASKLQHIDGILGVATYVGSHKVKIYYDPGKFTEEKVQEILFTPSKTLLRTVDKDVNTVQEVEMLLENFFDLYDFNYLSRLLQDKTEAIGVVSEFGCPVKVKVFFPGNAEVDLNKLKEVIETKKFTFTSNEKEVTVPLGYKFAKEALTREISLREYAGIFFDPFTAEFNDREKFSGDVVNELKIPVGANTKVMKDFKYLVSHLSADSGIIGIDTKLNDSLSTDILISYVDTITSVDNIYRKLNADTLRFTRSNGKEGKMVNRFTFVKTP